MRTPPALVLVVLLALAGCGKEPRLPLSQPHEMQDKVEQKLPKLGKLEYKVLKEGTLKAEGTTLSGSGDIQFVGKRPQNNRFKLSFELEAGSELTLVTNADETLKKALKITFFRAGKTVRLNVETLNEKGLKSNDETLKLAQLRLDASKPITLEVDIHGHGHFAVISGGVETDPQISFSKMKGEFTGLKLSNVKVTDAEIVGSKIED